VRGFGSSLEAGEPKNRGRRRTERGEFRAGAGGRPCGHESRVAAAVCERRPRKSRERKGAQEGCVDDRGSVRQIGVWGYGLIELLFARVCFAVSRVTAGVSILCPSEDQISRTLGIYIYICGRDIEMSWANTASLMRTAVLFLSTVLSATRFTAMANSELHLS